MLIIAEIACSHNGKIDKLKKLINDAYYAGADAVQFQIWDLRYMMSPKNSLYKKLKKIEFNSEDWIKIIKFTKKKFPKLKIYCCFYEHKSFEILKKIKIDGIKVNSSDLNNPLVLKQVAKFRGVKNLSVGGSSLEEIDYAVKFLGKKNIILMYGVQNFPTKIKDANLIKISDLKKKFKLPIGYQDHTNFNSEEKNTLCFISMAFGVAVLEKHICYTRAKRTYDFESALLKNEFKKFVYQVRIIKKSIGQSFSNKFTRSEKKYRSFQKKSIILIKKKYSGEKIKSEDVAFLRTNNLGVPPNKLNLIINRKLKKNLRPYNLIKLNHLK